MLAGNGYDFNILLNDKAALLKWLVTEKDIQSFEIEPSYNGSSFTKIGMVGANEQLAAYTYNDNLENLSKGKIYYRVKMISGQGKITNSNIIVRLKIA